MLVAGLGANVKIRIPTSMFDCSDHWTTTHSKYNKNVWKMVLPALGDINIQNCALGQNRLSKCLTNMEIVKAERWLLYLVETATIVNNVVG